VAAVMESGQSLPLVVLISPRPPAR
jgi:hypothetical protein